MSVTLQRTLTSLLLNSYTSNLTKAMKRRGAHKFNISEAETRKDQRGRIQKPALHSNTRYARSGVRVRAIEVSRGDKQDPSHPNLLSIPAEIRLEILRILLCKPEPLAPGEKSLAVNVLAVCRQLRQEGSVLLYEHNTIDIVLFDDDDHRSPNIEWLNYAWTYGMELDEVPRIFCLARKWRIILRGSQKDDLIDDDYSFDDRQAIHWLCALLRDNAQLEKVSMSIYVEYEQDYDEDNYIMDEVLEPFTFLRGLEKVDVHGVDPTYARDVEARMMSRIPAENIWKMKDVFWNWCEDHDPTKGVVDGIGADALDAINDCDVAKFKVERDKAVSKMGCRDLLSTERLYQFDIEEE